MTLCNVAASASLLSLSSGLSQQMILHGILFILFCEDVLPQIRKTIITPVATFCSAPINYLINKPEEKLLNK